MPLISLTKKQSADRCFLQQLDRSRIGNTAPPVFALIFPGGARRRCRPHLRAQAKVLARVRHPGDVTKGSSANMPLKLSIHLLAGGRNTVSLTSSQEKDPSTRSKASLNWLNPSLNQEK